MMKYRLVTPGPAMVPPDTLLELAKPVVHHRTAENKQAIAKAIELLKKTFVTGNDVVILTSSGTGGMETAVSNMLRPGDKAIVLTAGKWGERWVELCKAFGANTIVLEAPYGKVVEPGQLAEALKQHPETAAVYSTLCDTSTAVAHDIESIGELVAKTPAVLAVDGISGVGAMECRTDDWNIDLLVVGSQKALMLPPGLACVSASPKAKARLEAIGPRANYYFDLKKALASAKENDTPYTPAHTLIAALVRSLELLLKDGIESVWRRTESLSRAMLAAVDAMGLVSLAERPAAALTAIVAPAGIDPNNWAKLLEKKFGVKVAGGQGSLKSKIIRVAHMGYIDALDLVGIVAALEWSLAELGYSVEPGAGVSAATRSLAGDLVPVSANTR